MELYPARLHKGSRGMGGGGQESEAVEWDENMKLTMK